MRMHRPVAILVAALTITLALALLAAEPKAETGNVKQWEQTVDKAIAFLKANQAGDGSWGGKQSPGITGVVLTGMLRTGRIDNSDPVVEKALKYIESLINPKAGHIAGKDPRIGLQNYVTSVNVLALVTAGRDSYKPVIADATKFLRKLQWDEEEGKTKKDDFFGGAGYDSKSRPDLSNTQFFLDALVAAGVPKTDPAYAKAAIFVSRCQNIKGEHTGSAVGGQDRMTAASSTAPRPAARPRCRMRPTPMAACRATAA